MAKLLPRTKVPALSVKTVSGEIWTLAERKPERFALVVFYRGLHCPICRGYLGELAKLEREFKTRGVEVVAISSDEEERARRAVAEWQLADLTVGYGLDLSAARDWGLFISSSRGKTSAGIEEPAQFSEPGVFLVRPDGTLYWSAIQTMPFARPHFRELLSAVDFVTSRGITRHAARYRSGRQTALARTRKSPRRKQCRVIVAPS